MFLAAGVASMVLTAAFYTPIVTRSWDVDRGVADLAAAGALDAAGVSPTDLLLSAPIRPASSTSPAAAGS